MQRINARTIKYLPVEVDSEREVSVYLTFADKEFAGPATKRLAEIFKEHLSKACTGEKK